MTQSRKAAASGARQRATMSSGRGSEGRVSQAADALSLGARSAPTNISALQTVAGNAAVQRLLGRPSRVTVQREKPDADSGSPARKGTKKLEAAVRSGKPAVAASESLNLFNLDDTYYVHLLAYKLGKHAPASKKHKLYANAAPQTAAFAKKYLGETGLAAFEWFWSSRNVTFVSESSWYLDFLPDDKRIALATEDPQFFITNVLGGQKRRGDAESVRKTLSVAGVRNALRAGAPVAWQAFASTVPMVGLAEQTHAVVKGGAQLTTEQIIDRIFDDLVANRGIDVGYFTNNIPEDTNNTILTGLSQQEKNQRLLRAATDATKPSRPSMQCDNLMKLFQTVVSMYPGLTPKFGIAIEPQALLTVPLTGLPGGLIPNSFAGNVVDQTGAYTNQIFFTGVVDAAAPNSHTWNVVDGKAYDSVLGTKGAQVAASKEEAFTQVPGQKRWVNGTKELTVAAGRQAAANRMGFGTCYLRNW